MKTISIYTVATEEAFTIICNSDSDYKIIDAFIHTMCIYNENIIISDELVYEFTTNANIKITIKYDYIPAVPDARYNNI